MGSVNSARDPLIDIFQWRWKLVKEVVGPMHSARNPLTDNIPRDGALLNKNKKKKKKKKKERKTQKREALDTSFVSKRSLSINPNQNLIKIIKWKENTF